MRQSKVPRIGLVVVLTRAVDRRRMDRRVLAEVKVVSLLTRASFLISTYAAVR